MQQVHSTMMVRLWTGFLVVAASLSAWHPITNVDVFFRMSLGRAVLREGARSVAEPNAFLAFDGLRVVPQWLWDVGAYLLYDGFGPAGLAIATMLIAGAGAYAICRLTAELNRGGPPAAEMIAAGIAVAAAMARTTARPQALFFLLLPVFMLLCYRYARATGSARIRLGVLCAVGVLLWTQLHGSFVVAPAIWLACVIPSAIAKGVGSSRDRRVDAAVLASSLLAMCTGAYGFGFIAYLLSHGSSDAVQHIVEMKAPSLQEITHSLTPMLPWTLGVFGVIHLRKPRWTALALWLLGFVLVLQATRFLAVATLFALPLTVAGAANLDRWARASWPRWQRIGPLVAIVPAIVLMAGWFTLSVGLRGPFFQLGLAEGEYPVLASTYLKRLPDGANVLTSFRAGPPLGFWSDGRIRTFIDGRTPLHFDSADFALQREIMHHSSALALAVDRYDIRAAVVDREIAACDLLAERWAPVVVEARYTTFVPRDAAEPLVGIAPCGGNFLTLRVCSESAGFSRSIRRLAELGPSVLTDMLSAEQMLRCGGDAQAAAALLSPSAGVSPLFSAAQRRVRIRALFATGEVERGFSLLLEAIGQGDLRAFQTISLQDSRQLLSKSKRREMLEAVVELMDDRTNPAIRARLASLCASMDDAECARFHGLRAAVRGGQNMRPTLEWLIKHHPSESVHRDIEAWLESLDRKGQNP